MPFILTSPSAANITIAAVTNLYQEPWIGKLEPEDAGGWIDELLLLVTVTRLHLKRSVLKQFDFSEVTCVQPPSLQSIGGMCYQAFYQRVLSSASDAQAKITCYVGAVLCPILGLPSLIVGAAAASTSSYTYLLRPFTSV